MHRAGSGGLDGLHEGHVRIATLARGEAAAEEAPVGGAGVGAKAIHEEEGYADDGGKVGQGDGTEEARIVVDANVVGAAAPATHVRVRPGRAHVGRGEPAEEEGLGIGRRLQEEQGDKGAEREAEVDKGGEGEGGEVGAAELGRRTVDEHALPGAPALVEEKD